MFEVRHLCLWMGAGFKGEGEAILTRSGLRSVIGPVKSPLSVALPPSRRVVVTAKPGRQPPEDKNFP